MLGGGPAGAAASRLLARRGHTVHLITRPAADHRLAVSLPPSCAKLFDTIGVTEAIERAGFIRSTGNTVWWGHDEPRVEQFAESARGWQVELGALESVLLEEAARAGVTIERQVLAPGESAVPDPPSFVLDCSGRTGLIARARNLRRYDDGPTTVALAGEWRRAARTVEAEKIYRIAGIATTASLSAWATRATGCPEATTWPGSARVAVTTPSASARSVA